MQYEVFQNPIPPARKGFPYVVALQSDFAETGESVVVGFLARLEELRTAGGRLAPIVMVGGKHHMLMMRYLTNLRRTDLKRAIASLDAERDKITAALDFLFFGL